MTIAVDIRAGEDNAMERLECVAVLQTPLSRDPPLGRGAAGINIRYTYKWEPAAQMGILDMQVVQDITEPRMMVVLEISNRP